jgi:hypothetical protein
MWVYYCHNKCGSMSFLKTYLKNFHRNLYRKIIFHGFKRQSDKTVDVIEEENAEEKYQAIDLYKFKKGELVNIYDEHPTAVRALQFCKDRKIPKGTYKFFLVCLKNDKFFDKDESGRFIMNDKGYPKGNEYGNRLIIPYFTFGGNWLQFDARALDPNTFFRYRNLEGAERELYNAEWLDVTKPFYLLEGSIDSTFIKNSVAFGGTKHLKAFLEQYPEILENAHNGTVIWDNDEAGYDEMPVTIKMGFNWFNWSKIHPKEKYTLKSDGGERTIKDINDIVLFTDALELDEAGYIKTDSLKKYIETAKGGMIKIIMMYGNRVKKKKESLQKFFKGIKTNENSKGSILKNWSQ